ncbi:hypothetical protein GCM10027447_23460 [Glycomyces halotolerans]
MPLKLTRSPLAPATTGGLAALAVTATLFTGLTWAGFGLAVLTLLLAWRLNPLNELAVDQAARALGVAALVIAAANSSSSGTPLVLALAGSAILALIAAEGVVAGVIGAVRLDSAHLVVHRDRLLKWFDSTTVCRLITALGFAAALASAVEMGLSAAWASWLLGAAVTGVIAALAVGTAAAWRQRRASAHSGDAAVRDAVSALEPRFLVHLAGPPESDFHLLMWLEYFDRIGDPYLIVLRSPRLLPRLLTATQTPIVVAPRITDVEGLLTDSARAVFYVNNSMENAQLVRTGRLTHVQLMHGDSDKVASRNPVSAMYDLIFVAGQAGIDRYRAHGVDIPDEKFRIVGRPQLESVAVGPRNGDDGQVVLYAPTWSGTSDGVNYSSLHIGKAIITALLDHGATVVLRAHPFTRHNSAAAARLTELERLLAADGERTGRRHLWGTAASERMSLADCVNAADAAVTDVSGAASDWLYSGKPFAITDVHGKYDKFVEQFPLARGAYRIDADAANIGAVVTDLLGGDPLAGAREATRTYYLGDIPPEHCVETFLEAARACYRPVHETA